MKKKLNVLFDTTSLIDRIISHSGNGIFFAAYNILAALSQREELNLYLYCSSKKMPMFDDAAKIDNILSKNKLYNHSKFDSIIIYWETLNYKNQLNNRNRFLRMFIKLILGILKIAKSLLIKFKKNNQYEHLYKDIDIFFSPHQMVPIEFQNIQHIQKYVLLHDIIPMILPEYNKEWQKKKGWFWELFQSINKNDFYFANSEYTKQDFVKHVPKINPEHIKVIPLSTGANYQKTDNKTELEKVKEKYNIPSDKKYLFSLCTLEPRKNLIFAVKNFIEFIKKNNIDDFVFVLGGGQWDNFMKQLGESINDLEKYKDKIIKIGYVDNDDMSALYSGAEMFVFPSLYEGFGIPVLEAMQCGCPVVCSNTTSIPEVINDCGIQINPTKDEELIKAFEKMYFDKEFRLECSKKGLERANLFTWEKCINTIIKEIMANASK